MRTIDLAPVARNANKLEIETLYRSAKIERDETGQIRGLDKDKRTVRVQFSSEAPVKRWFGNEILDHAASSVDMSRVVNGAAVLCEHDTAQRCGITEGGEITSKRTGEAVVRFARTPLGDQVMNEVEDGTLRWISVGYRVDKFEVDEDEDEEEYRAVRWTPLEVSFVAIPADTSARVLRSNQSKHTAMITPTNKNRAPAETAVEHGAEVELGDETEGAPEGESQEQRTARINAAVTEIFALAHRFEPRFPGAIEEAERCIKDDGERALEVMQRWVLNKQAKDGRVGPGGTIRDRKGTETLSYGEAFTQTEQYKRFGKSTGSKRTIACSLADRLQFRATFSATTEALTSIQKQPGVPGILDQQPLFIADLFAGGETDSTTVRYIQEDSYTNAATAVAEGAGKPEATLNVSEVDATVRKIAVWTKVTDEMLADYQQMSSYINARLAYMVQALEDQHLLSGTGNTNQIKGVLNFTGIQTVSGATDPLSGIMKAIAYVRGANGSGYGEPDAIVMNPLDWMNSKLTKDLNGQYYGGGPFSGIYGAGMYSNVYNMWGLPCVVTSSISQGTALVGAFRTAGQIFRKRGLTIESTNSNEDDFKNNLVMLRAEERLALAVYQPKKFCTVTGIPAV